MYASLRDMALRTSAHDLGIRPGGPAPTVYGVVMDIKLDGETITVVAYETGDASIYISTGGGTIGGIGHERVAAAARAFVAAARPRLDAMTRTTRYPRPGRGQATFYVLTSAGVHVASGTTDALDTGGEPLSLLFAAGQEVVTQFRLSEPSR